MQRPIQCGKLSSKKIMFETLNLFQTKDKIFLFLDKILSIFKYRIRQEDSFLTR